MSTLAEAARYDALERAYQTGDASALRDADGHPVRLVRKPGGFAFLCEVCNADPAGDGGLYEPADLFLAVEVLNAGSGGPGPTPYPFGPGTRVHRFGDPTLLGRITTNTGGVVSVAWDNGLAERWIRDEDVVVLPPSEQPPAGVEPRTALCPACGHAVDLHPRAADVVHASTSCRGRVQGEHGTERCGCVFPAAQAIEAWAARQHPGPAPPTEPVGLTFRRGEHVVHAVTRQIGRVDSDGPDDEGTIPVRWDHLPEQVFHVRPEELQGQATASLPADESPTGPSSTRIPDEDRWPIGQRVYHRKKLHLGLGRIRRRESQTLRAVCWDCATSCNAVERVDDLVPVFPEPTSPPDRAPVDRLIASASYYQAVPMKISSGACGPYAVRFVNGLEVLLPTGPLSAPPDFPPLGDYTLVVALVPRARPSDP